LGAELIVLVPVVIFDIFERTDPFCAGPAPQFLGDTTPLG
jgi:hypothetical protein